MEGEKTAGGKEEPSQDRPAALIVGAGGWQQTVFSFPYSVGGSNSEH